MSINSRIHKLEKQYLHKKVILAILEKDDKYRLPDFPILGPLNLEEIEKRFGKGYTLFIWDLPLLNFSPRRNEA